MEKLKVLDLFSGIGGFSLGLERTGAFETVAFCEIEEFPQKILRKHWPDVPIYEDVRNVTAERLRADGIFPKIITGGFPCQDLSQAGKQEGIAAARSGLYKEYLRILSEGEFEYAVFENVAELLVGDSGRWFAQFLYDLAEVGYDAEWHCISASRFGAAHHRDRVWIVAYPNGTNEQGLDFSKSIVANSEESRRRELTRAVNAALPANDYIRVRENLDAVPREMDGLKAYGNSVFPDIVEYLGYAILGAYSV